MLRRQSNARWYCLAIHPHYETLAEYHLSVQRFVAYCPRWLKPLKKLREGRLFTELPLFPGYMFVSLDLAADRWHPILSTIGVKSMFRADSGMPRPMPAADMRLIRQTVAELSPQPAPTALPPPASPELPGLHEEVRIIDGPFAGFGGIITELVGQDRAKLPVMFFGQISLIEIPRKHLVRV